MIEEIYISCRKISNHKVLVHSEIIYLSHLSIGIYHAIITEEYGNNKIKKKN